MKIHLFFFSGRTSMSIQTVGIIGAGTMGNGIAQACAVSGIQVVMVDISDAAVAKGLATVASSLDRLVKKEKTSEADKVAALARIHAGTYGQCTDCDATIPEARLNAAPEAARCMGCQEKTELNHH
jgi:3-hydroxybutyryl-CoA dehydrogenase